MAVAHHYTPPRIHIKADIPAPRRYRNGTLLIKPSSEAIGRLRDRFAAEMRAPRGSNAAAVIAALSPVIRGWAA